MNVERFIEGLQTYLVKQLSPFATRLQALEDNQTNAQATVDEEIARHLETLVQRVDAIDDRSVTRSVEVETLLDRIEHLEAAQKDFDVSVEQLDERTISINVMNGDEVVSTKSITIPAMIYRGVHDVEAAYEKGDTVTAGGSLWHCEKSGPEGKPGDSSHWKLAVKKGRDAK